MGMDNYVTEARKRMRIEYRYSDPSFFAVNGDQNFPRKVQNREVGAQRLGGIIRA